MAAAARERTVRDRAWFALLADVAGIADGRLSLERRRAHIGEPLTLVRQVLVPVSSTLARLQIPLLLSDEPPPKFEPVGCALASRGKRFAFRSYPFALPSEGSAALSYPPPLLSSLQPLVEPGFVPATLVEIDPSHRSDAGPYAQRPRVPGRNRIVPAPA